MTKNKMMFCRLAFGLAACAFLSACVATPEETFVAAKNEDWVSSSRSDTSMESDEGNCESMQTVTITDEYFGAEDNVVIKISADVDVSEQYMPVYRVVPHVFTSDDVKAAAEVFFDGHTAYEYAVTKTKSELEELVLGLKKRLGDEEQLLKDSGGNEDDMLSLKEDLQYELSIYEAEYETAPEEDDIPEAEYVWKDYLSYEKFGDTVQGEMDIYDHTDRIKLQAEIDGGLVTVDVMNRSGEDYQFHDLIQHYYINEMMPFQKDAFTESEDEIAKTVEDKINALGVGEWKCDSLTCFKNRDGYYYYITMARYYEGVKCIPQAQPEYYDGADDCFARSKYESIALYYADGRITTMYFEAPYDIVSVETDSAEVISLDDALARFKEQMQIQAMIPVDEDGLDEYGNAAPKGAEISITRIELGLARVRIKNSEAEYYLLPVWNFKGEVGVDYGDGPFFESSLFEGVAISNTILTINALDGTIIDVSKGF